MAAVPAARRMSPEEYFVWEEMQELKHKYFYDEVFAMANGTARHASLTINVATALSNALRGSGRRVFSGDLRIELAAGTHYVYPDLSVVCGEARFTSDRQTTLLNPTLAVEVLSRSTGAYDRGLKLAAYGRVASLREVVLVAQDRRSVEVFRPNDSGGGRGHRRAGVGRRRTLARRDVRGGGAPRRRPFPAHGGGVTPYSVAPAAGVGDGASARVRPGSRRRNSS